VVYIDVRGVGRAAILKSSAKGFVKARLKNGETVELQGDGREGEVLEVVAGEAETEEDGSAVVGMTEVGRSTALEGKQVETVGTGMTRRTRGDSDWIKRDQTDSS